MYPSDGGSDAPGPRPLVVLILLVIMPMVLRLAPIDHGMPRNYVADTHFVRNALGMARDRNPVPPVGRYSTYPNLLPYMLLPVFAVEYGVGRAMGEWGSAQEFGHRLMEEPELAHLPARIFVALLASLAPLFVFLTARTLGMRGGAWVAGYLVATGLLHLHFSVQERPWAPVCTFIALSAWPAARFVVTGGGRYLVLSGLAAGLAFASHQAGLLALGLPGLAWLLGPVNWWGAQLLERIKAGFKCVGLFAVTALVLGYPYLILHGGQVEDAVVNQGQVAGQDVAIGGLGFVLAMRWESTVKLASALFGYDPLLVVLGLLGLPLMLRHRVGWPFALFTLFWAFFFLTNQADHIRYLLPLSVLLALPAGLAAERVLRTGGLTSLGLSFLLVFPLVQSLRLVKVMQQDDTRALAEAYLSAHQADKRLAIDVQGPRLPLDGPALERLARHRELAGRERHRLLYFDAGVSPPGGAGFDALPLEAVFDYNPRDWSSWVEDEEIDALTEDPNEALRLLGMDLLLTVDRTPNDGRLALLLDDGEAAPDADGNPGRKMPPVRTLGAPLITFHPGRGGSASLDANLPGALTFPLTQLWSLERPGPRLDLYELPAASGSAGND